MRGQPIQADPAFIYVRPDGNNSACNGEYDAPATAAPNCAVQTIGQGVYSVTLGGTVSVAAGTYTENVTINKALSLQGANPADDPDAAIVAGDVTVTSAGAGATVRQLRIIPGNVTGNAAAIFVNASNVTISENVIDGITGNGTGTVKGIHLYSGALPGITNIAVTSNTIQNVTNPLSGGGSYSGADGIMVQGVITDVTLIANTIQTVTSAGWAYGIEIAPTASAPWNPPENVLAQQNYVVNVNYGDTYTADPYTVPYPGVGVIIDAVRTMTGSIIASANASQVTFFGNTISNVPAPLANTDITHTLNASGNYLGYTDPVSLAQVISQTLVGRIDYTPWLANDADTAPSTPGFQGDFSALWVGPHNEQTGAVGRIQEGVDLVTTGGTVRVTAGTYRELIAVTKSCTLAGESGVVIQPSENIHDFSSNHDGAVIWIQAPDVSIRTVLIDGDNPDIGGGHAYGGADINALRGIYMSATAFDHLLVENVTLHNLGRGIDLYGGQNHTLRDNFTDNLGGPDNTSYGYGVLLHNDSSAQVSGNTFYAVITAIGVSSDSIGQSVSMTATNNFINEADTGLSLSGTTPIDHVTFAGNRLSDLTTAFRVGTTGDLYAYANNVDDFVTAIDDPTHTLNTRHNWWGTYLTQPNGVDNDSWYYRLGAPVETWGVGMLADARLTSAGESGTGVIVGHGYGVDRAPFGQATLPYGGAPCSDYYDFFVLNNTGPWTVRVPLDTSVPGCTAEQQVLYHFTLTDDGWPDTSCSGADCWLTSPGLTRDGDYLEATVDAGVLLQGTPFIAGNGLANLVVSKENFRTTVQPGETLAYLITITNTGIQNAAGILLTDTLPADTAFLVASNGGTHNGSGVVTWPTFTLPGNGASTTRLVVATLGDPLRDRVDVITNTVTATMPYEEDETDNTAWYTNTVNAAPAFTLSKSDGGVNAIPGTTLVYTLTYANVGNQHAIGVVITETVPEHTSFDAANSSPDWTCANGAPGGTLCTYPVGNLSAGFSGNATFAVRIVSTLPAGVTHIDNTTTIADDGSNSADLIPVNRTATLATPVVAAPDLEISKSGSADSVTPGATLTYQIVVTNTGNQGATNLHITDHLPAHTTVITASDGGSQTAPGIVTWSISALEGGSTSITRLLTVSVVNPFPADTNVITNTVTVADDGANGPDSTLGNNTATITTTLDAAPILALSKDNDVTTVTPGSTLIYQLVITNTGNQLAAGIVLTDTLPEHTAFILASHDGAEENGVVTWPAFDLPGGGVSTTRLLVVNVENPLPAGITAITNTAALHDNSGLTVNATDADAVDASPNFILTKTSAVTTTTPGATLSYAITITNTGNQDATGVIISDTLPADVTFTAGNASDSGVLSAPGIVTWPAFDLASGASATRYLTVTVDDTLPAGLELIINTVDAVDDRGYTATNQHATIITATPDLEIGKSNGVNTVEPGDTLVYTLTITNSGPQGATGVRITDYLPAHTTFVSASDGGAQTTPGIVAWPTFPLAGGDASVTRLLTVTVINPFPADTNVITNTASVTDDGTNGPDPTPQNITTDTDAVFATPQLVIAKSNDVDTAYPGDALTYHITLTNTGNLEATDILITDTLPLSTTFVAASDGGAQTAPGSGIVTWPPFNLPGGDANVTRLVIVTVDSPLPAGVDAITNTVAAIAPDQTLLTATQDVDTVIAAPDLALSKRAGNVTVEPGDALVYTLTYANTGNQGATGVVITETVPAHTTFAGSAGWIGSGTTYTYTIDSLPAGNGGSVTFAVMIDPTLPAEVTQIVNTAEISDDGANDADTNPANNTDSTVIPVIAAPDLTLSKSDGGVTTAPGATLVYTLTYTNVGNQEATGITIAETVPVHTTFDVAASTPGWTCADGAPAGTPCTYDAGNLEAGDSNAVQFAVNVVAPVPAGLTHIHNTASIADDGSNGADPNLLNNSATIATLVAATPDLEIGKSNGVDTVEPGDTLVYTLTIANSGPQGATGVRITDELPAHTTFVSASDGGTQTTPGIVTWPTFPLAGGGVSVTRWLTVTVIDPFPVDTNVITNTATVADDGANGPDPTPENNSTADVDDVSAAPMLALSKSNAVTTVTPGSTLIYRLVITNSGTQLAAGIMLSDTLPEHTAFVSASDGGQETPSGSGIVVWPAFDLPARNSATRLLVVTVDTPLSAGVTAITNTATLRDNRDNTATAQDTDAVDANPLLVLDKTNAVDSVVPGETVVYTLTLTNNGNQAATDILITDTLPADVIFVAASGGGVEIEPGIVAWPTFNLAGGGASVTRYLTVRVNLTLPAGLELLINTAQASEDRGYTAMAQHADLVIAAPDLEISKSNGVAEVEPGDTLIYQIVVANSGSQGATGIRITDYLPAHTDFVSASDGGTQTTPGVVTWPTFNLASGGASVTRWLTVTVANPFPVDTNVITNTATVADDGANGPDPTPGNNSATDVDDVFAAPDLLMSKDNGLTTVTPGSTLIYRLVITNSGTQLAAGIVLTDTLPEHTFFYLASDNGWESAPGIITWPAFDLPGGASTTRLLVVTVDNPLPAGVTAITNYAALRDNRNNTATAQDTDAVDANPLLFLDKTNAVDTTVPGATLVYTLTLTNNGNQEATGILITDTLPADVTFVEASDGGTEIEPGIIAWPAFNLAGGGASATRFLTVTVNATLPAGVELLINTARAIEDRGYDAIAQHVDVVVAAPNLAITKTDGGIAPQPGAVLVYTLTYANVGEQGATGAVISETVPAYAAFDAAASSTGWTCLDGAPAGTSCVYAVDDLPANASGDIAFAVRVVTPLPVYVRETANTAAIADDGSNGADTDPTNNTASIITSLDATIDLLITKDDGGTTVEPSETIVYTLTYANNGDQIAGGVIITETVPALTTFNQTASSPGWTCAGGSPAGTVCTYALGDVIEGGTVLFAVDVVLPFPIEVSEITNQVVIGADANNIPDANPNDNTATAITTIITRPDLVTGKDDRFSVVQPGQQVTYIITATNVGTQNATNVQLTDTLPIYVSFLGASNGGAQSSPGVVTWPTIPQLSLDEIITRTLTVMVDSTLPAGALQITNTVTVSDDGTHGPDLNPGNNTATDVDIVGAMPDLILDKTVNYAVIYPNGLLAYTIHVENTGSRGASGVTIVDNLPPDVHFVSASDGGYESAPGVVTWPAITLNVGEEVVRTLTARVGAGLPDGVVLTNTATVSDDGLNGEDPVPENNTDTASSVIKWPIVYLPIVMRGYAVGPDLIVEDIVVSNGDIAITIRNQGKLEVPDTLGFWVDLYINPLSAPTHVNQTWDLIAPYGAAWGVDREAIPILPGESRTLYLYDIYYKRDYSRLPVALKAGDIIYVQVDSYNGATNYGVVYEDHEMGGGEYNNIARLIIHSYTPLNLVTSMQSPPELPEADVLPERP